MAEIKDWARWEVDLCVEKYFLMLTFQMNGQTFNKSMRARTLAQSLSQRTEKSVKLKYSNISAVMTDLGYPIVSGYRPMPHYQRVLTDAIREHLMSDAPLHESISAAVQRPAARPDIVFHQKLWVEAPKIKEHREDRNLTRSDFSAVQRDYLALEAQNRSLGKAGEEYIVELEMRRLHNEGAVRLAERVEHVAQTRGDGLGFDVLSYETSGRERKIEVKTTAFDIHTPFYVTATEVKRSELDAATYHLYRVFDFRNLPRLYSVPGSIRNRFRLEAATFLARIA